MNPGTTTITVSLAAYAVVDYCANTATLSQALVGVSRSWFTRRCGLLHPDVSTPSVAPLLAGPSKFGGI
jgi:hypothetical protein